MEEGAKKGTVTSLASMFPAEDAQKAAKRVQETLAEEKAELDRVRGFISDNTSLINLVQKLPDELHHDIMVPFGKAAFFPGRLVHTNEFLVLLGEGYYAERTSKQTVEILKRRGNILESQAESMKAMMQDLQAEASFFGATASEAAEGLVEIREDYVEENFTERQSPPGPPKEDAPTFSEADEAKVEVEDEEYARMMSRLDELEKEETEAECASKRDKNNTKVAINEEEYARLMSRFAELEKEELEAECGNEGGEDTENVAVIDEKYAHMLSSLDELEKEEPETESSNESDEDEKIKANFDRLMGHKSLNKNLRISEEYQSRKHLEPRKDKKSATEELLTKQDPQQNLTDQLNCTGLTVQSAAKDEASRTRSFAHTLMKSFPEKALMPPEVRENVQPATSSRSEVPVQTSKSGFDSHKAFTGSIVERTHNIQTNSSQQTAISSQAPSSQPSKPVSRFKMQRR
ncbi:hypothetical protein CJ030_MR1G023378 [Morella rubra]|uniref:RNA polymerase II subunit 5-mediating protein n=1 Tax=Morella rubra TaxID=262757 RepID=A0A6A1WS37_9ROSI|nr:hypothetical protein CJ030_MR1G023378 [Morella rubra]